jgi:hypothetical protein
MQQPLQIAYLPSTNVNDSQTNVASGELHGMLYWMGAFVKQLHHLFSAAVKWKCLKGAG